MKVFISWSGERSREMAQALHDWLPLVLHYVSPWVSTTNINAGDRWAIEIAKQLEEASFGIICLTRENLEAPWVLFEAGALAKSLTLGAVVPFLLDVDFAEIGGPLAQFQAKKVEEKATLEVLEAINQRSPEPVENIRLVQLFDVLWPKLEGRMRNIPEAIAPARVRGQNEILEELVTTTRSVEQRMRDLERVVQREFQTIDGIPKPGIESSSSDILRKVFDTERFQVFLSPSLEGESKLPSARVQRQVNRLIVSGQREAALHKLKSTGMGEEWAEVYLRIMDIYKEAGRKKE